MQISQDHAHIVLKPTGRRTSQVPLYSHMNILYQTNRNSCPSNQKNDKISGVKIHEETFHKLFFHQGNPQLHFMQFRASTRLTSIFRLTFSRKRDASNSGLKFSNVHLMSVGAEIRDSLQYPGKPRAKLMYCSTLYRTMVLEIQVSQPGHQSETLSLFKE